METIRLTDGQIEAIRKNCEMNGLYRVRLSDEKAPIRGRFVFEGTRPYCPIIYCTGKRFRAKDKDKKTRKTMGIERKTVDCTVLYLNVLIMQNLI